MLLFILLDGKFSTKVYCYNWDSNVLGCYSPLYMQWYNTGRIGVAQTCQQYIYRGCVQK